MLAEIMWPILTSCSFANRLLLLIFLALGNQYLVKATLKYYISFQYEQEVK